MQAHIREFVSGGLHGLLLVGIVVALLEVLP